MIGNTGRTGGIIQLHGHPPRQHRPKKSQSGLPYHIVPTCNVTGPGMGVADAAKECSIGKPIQYIFKHPESKMVYYEAVGCTQSGAQKLILAICYHRYTSLAGSYTIPSNCLPPSSPHSMNICIGQCPILRS